MAIAIIGARAFSARQNGYSKPEHIETRQRKERRAKRQTGKRKRFAPARDGKQSGSRKRQGNDAHDRVHDGFIRTRHDQENQLRGIPAKVLVYGVGNSRLPFHRTGGITHRTE